MAELIKKGNYYKGHGNVIVKATSDEYLTEGNRLAFYGLIAEHPDRKMIGRESRFVHNVFKPCNEPAQSVYDRALRVFGEKAQLEMAQEEATEMALAVRKYTRMPSYKTLKDMCEEIADTEIMIAQIKQMIPKTVEQIENTKTEKLNRLANNLDKIEKGSRERVY